MSVKELKPKLDPETCAVCGRRMLQGEVVNWYLTPDSSRHPVCELCVSRAERARWVRERDGEQLMPMRPARAARAGIFRRMGRFFGADGEERFGIEEFEQPAEVAADQVSRRKARSAKRREPSPPVAEEPRSVRAVPTGPAARLAQGLALFNESQFPRTIAGLSRSLGDPQVAAVNKADASVEVFVGWDIVWYSYRVDLGDATEPVEQSGRGNDTAELAGEVADWNAVADDYGRLILRESAATETTRPEPKPEPERTAESREDDPPRVYGGD
ncbi:MAG: hypothetical protein HY827_09295 [Actinobacteria bacterium]|nr:hypothetical protein [Actinomycetota bacterium]